MSDKMEKFHGQEDDSGTRSKAIYDIPDRVSKNDICVKYGTNSYVIEYSVEKKEQKKDHFYSSKYRSHFSKSFPYKICNPSAVINDNKIVFEFDKGEEIDNNYDALDMNEMQDLEVKMLK